MYALSTFTCMQDPDLARDVQQLFASPYMRVNTTTDVTGVEICGALKNVLAIAAGIVEGLDLGHNAMAALVAQVCITLPICSGCCCCCGNCLQPLHWCCCSCSCSCHVRLLPPLL